MAHDSGNGNVHLEIPIEIEIYRLRSPKLSPVETLIPYSSNAIVPIPSAITTHLPQDQSSLRVHKLLRIYRYSSRDHPFFQENIFIPKFFTKPLGMDSLPPSFVVPSRFGKISSVFAPLSSPQPFHERELQIVNLLWSVIRPISSSINPSLEDSNDSQSGGSPNDSQTGGSPNDSQSGGSNDSQSGGSNDSKSGGNSNDSQSGSSDDSQSGGNSNEQGDGNSNGNEVSQKSQV